MICSDIARYGVKTAGEPTQGAGAVAMVISDNPALLEIDVGISGAATTDVHDFWRPLGMREAQVDGHYSVQCYLDALAAAYRGWKDRAMVREIVRDNDLASEQLARICYHVPFCKMARKAHLHVRKCDLDDTGAPWDVTAEETRGAASFKEQVDASLAACSRIGNVYTGSLYLSLAGLLETQAAALAGKRIGLFSYGSGCTSEFFSGVVTPRAAERMAGAPIAELLARRERITIEEYERIMALTSPIDAPPAPGTFRYTGAVEHRRQYARG